MELPSILSLACLLLALLASIFFYSHGGPRPAKQSKSKLGSFFELVKNSHRLLDWTTELLKSSPTHTVTTAIGVITANPATVEHFLKTRFDNYPKGDHFLYALEDFMGHGIFNADGDHWKIQRKTASLEFKTKTIRSFIMSNVRIDVVDRLLPLLSAAAANNKTIDLQEVLFRFAFDNVCKVVFNEDPARLAGDTAEGREFNEAFEKACNLTMYRFQHIHPLSWKLKRLLGVGSEGQLKENIAIVQRFAMRVIRSRKLAGKSALGDDLLSRFMVEEDYSDEFLRDILLSFVLAGRDTTSATLTWFFWLVSTRPAVRERIMDEIRWVRSKCGTGGDKKFFTLDEVREMDYLHAALSETLRLYPAVPLEGRTCLTEDVLPDGTAVKKGQWVMYNSYAMGRMEELWGEDRREFKPERWLENGVFQQKSPFLYPVFNAGPRTCLGKDMAYIQMKVVAASVMERFEIEVVDEKRKRVPEITIIMKMKGGLEVRLREKQAVEKKAAVA